MRSSLQKLSNFFQRHTLLVCVGMTVFAAVVPFARAFFRMEVDYNEGWNIYNAEAVARHQMLYPERFGWTSVNYPMLSFWLLGKLHGMTHDYLFTARVLSLLSLLACSVLVGAIVRRLGTSNRAAILSGLFCLALFCANCQRYVGMDDPQMLAHALFLACVLLYLRRKRSVLNMIATALLLTIAGCIKHNPVDVAFAIFFDIAFVSIQSALWFGLCGLSFAALAFMANLHFGGPFFLAQLLTPRSWSASKILDQFVNVFGPLLLPLCIALWTAWRIRKDPARRIVVLMLIFSVFIGGYFSGGSGVTINALFSAVFAMCILLGIFFDQIYQAVRSNQVSLANSQLFLRPFAPAILFIWLLIPLTISGNAHFIRTLREIRGAQQLFHQDITYLKTHPGPALCESLLECHEAGKPYVYDPFNATRLLSFHKLDEQYLVRQIQQHHFAVIQTDNPLPEEDRYNSERFTPAIRAAIEKNYTPALEHPRDLFDEDENAGQWTTLYLPRR